LNGSNRRRLMHKPETSRVARRVVDDRVFLLGLDNLYRDAMSLLESEQLLSSARKVAEALRVRPAEVPVEGYYGATPDRCRDAPKGCFWAQTRTISRAKCAMSWRSSEESGLGLAMYCSFRRRVPLRSRCHGR